MSTSEKTFTQVKDILRKLERSIDEAREKRLHEDDSPSQNPHQARPTAVEPGRAQPMSPRREPPRTPAAGWQNR